jgi:hypothetical protein
MKTHPERVIPYLAEHAMSETTQRPALFTHYIIENSARIPLPSGMGRKRRLLSYQYVETVL